MIQQTLVKILLAPFSLLYGVGISLRNFLYQKELLKGIRFDIPVISVGNLSIGGAGKTPHIEYLIRLLQPYIYVSTLSRGYKRSTKGFLLARPHHNAKSIGDEPLQFVRKFPGVVVAVAENRSFAVPQMMMAAPHLQAILLDDAFQHRSIEAGLNILLTQYNLPFTQDYLLPSGRLREWRSAYHRADVIIVTKCPEQVSEEEKTKLRREINLLAHQRLFFSKYVYENPYYIFNANQRLELDDKLDVFLICAIAGTDYLLKYLEPQVDSVTVLEYEDHHYFSENDMDQLKSSFERIKSERKIIITTEKDAMRLELHRNFIVQHRLPIFVLPIRVEFLFDEGKEFNEGIQNFLLNFRA